VTNWHSNIERYYCKYITHRDTVAKDSGGFIFLSYCIRKLISPFLLVGKVVGMGGVGRG
jgi:hypothetical protein